MASPPRADVVGLLHVLRKHDVNFVVVGGVAAVMHGAPIATFDLDIVHDRDRDNVRRLLAALVEISARRRDPAGRDAAPQATTLEGAGHHLLSTDRGPLDVLGQVGGGRDFAQLLPHSPRVEIQPGLQVNVLDLETLIELKRESERDKDRAALPLLLRTLRERGSRP